MKIDLFTLNKYFGILFGALTAYLKHGSDASVMAFGAAFGYGLSFLITASIVALIDGRSKLSDFQYILLSRERFIFSFKSDTAMFAVVLIYLIIFSAAAIFYNPALTYGNALFFGFIALSFFCGTSLIIHANLLILIFIFALMVFINLTVSYFNIVEFIRDSTIVIYFPLSFFCIAGYISEYKRLEYSLLSLIFKDDAFEDTITKLFKLNKNESVKLPETTFKKIIASAFYWILLLTELNFDFTYFYGFLSIIKN